MKDFMNMMKQAKELQSKMAEMQAEIEQLTRDGTAGAGLVTVTINGKGEMRAVSVDPSLMKPDEKEILEDLIVAAHADAKAKMEEALQEKMKDMTGGLPLPPGMKF
ncbi:YbaB/EbfC family nucleoid-associated protein [Dichotomicrobium thermohalophilum]|nr:YbaB/EbfC family nucleoid-associated protein [Dichotomicrobium thermohalophilum]